MTGTNRPFFPTPGTVRIGGPAAIPALLAELGADPEEVFSAAGVPLALFDDPENQIPFVTLGQLLKRCVETTGCRHFGLLVGQRGGFSSLGLIGHLAQNSTHVESALRSLVRYLHLHDRGAVPTLTIEGEHAIIGYAIYQGGIEAIDQIADAAIAIACNLLQALCGAQWQPVAVRLAHRPPTDVTPYRRFFRCPLHFDTPDNSLVFAASLLQKSLPNADTGLRLLLQQRIDELDSWQSVEFAEQVRRVLRTSILSHRASVKEIADLFSMHRRTLNRRLGACDTSFRQLLDTTRQQLAEQLLEHSQRTLGQIAAELGYADDSAFGRAFARWCGMTPGRWRAERRRQNHT